MSDEILKSNNDGYIAVTRESGAGTLWSDAANCATIVERPAAPKRTAHDRAVTTIAQRIADSILRGLASHEPQ